MLPPTLPEISDFNWEQLPVLQWGSVWWWSPALGKLSSHTEHLCSQKDICCREAEGTKGRADCLRWWLSSTGDSSRHTELQRCCHQCHTPGAQWTSRWERGERLSGSAADSPVTAGYCVGQWWQEATVLAFFLLLR